MTDFASTVDTPRAITTLGGAGRTLTVRRRGGRRHAHVCGRSSRRPAVSDAPTFDRDARERMKQRRRVRRWKRRGRDPFEMQMRRVLTLLAANRREKRQ